MRPGGLFYSLNCIPEMSKIMILLHLSGLKMLTTHQGFPGGSDGKESACNVGDLSSIPGLGRYPGEGNGNPLQYSCLEDPMD